MIVLSDTLVCKSEMVEWRGIMEQINAVCLQDCWSEDEIREPFVHCKCALSVLLVFLFLEGYELLIPWRFPPGSVFSRGHAYILLILRVWPITENAGRSEIHVGLFLKSITDSRPVLYGNPTIPFFQGKLTPYSIWLYDSFNVWF